jgi:hypothetical protein
VQLSDLRHQLTEVGDWSPADDTIAFVSQGRGSRQLYVIGSSGGPAVALTKQVGVNRGTGWTRDGRGYYYEVMRSGHVEVWKAFPGGGQPECVVADAENGFESARGYFYYWRHEPGQKETPMRRTANGDEKVLFTPAACPGCLIVGRSEGLYYVTADTNDIYLFNETTAHSARVLKSPEGRLLTLRIPPMGASGAVSRWSGSICPFTLSADARWFAYGAAAHDTAELMIMENFH